MAMGRSGDGFYLPHPQTQFPDKAPFPAPYPDGDE